MWWHVLKTFICFSFSSAKQWERRVFVINRHLPFFRHIVSFRCFLSWQWHVWYICQGEAWHASGKQNTMWRRQCVKTIERVSTKVCCSGHMLQCLISRSGETWLSEKKMMNTFTLGDLLQWRMTFQRREHENQACMPSIWEAFRHRQRWQDCVLSNERHLINACGSCWHMEVRNGFGFGRQEEG